MKTCSITGVPKPCPVIGFGAWGIGGMTPGGTSYGDISEADAQDCISAAHSAGMRLFDTSPAYGYGNSERRLRSTLAHERENMILATKGGLTRYDEAPDFSTSALAEGLEHSLDRLGASYVDIFQLHNPPASLMKDEAGLVGFFDGLKKSGKATTVGISVKSPDDAVALLAAYPFDTVQVNLNMLDVRALTSGLLDLCAKQDIAVLARTPLCFGFLSLTIDGGTKFSEGDHRAHWSQEQLAVWAGGARQAQKIAEKHDPVEASPAARALRFCLLHPAVKCVLTGPMTAPQTRENAGAGNLPPLAGGCAEDILSLNARASFFVRG